MVDADEQHRRLERERGDGTGRHPDRPVIDHRGDHGDARGETADSPPISELQIVSAPSIPAGTILRWR